MKTRFSHRRPVGFTLIEVLVVVAIVAALAGTVALSFSGVESRNVRNEADRLAAVLRSARDQAVLENRLLVVSFEPGGYRFLTPDEKGALTPVVDDLLRPRRLGFGVRIDRVAVEGQLSATSPRLVLAPTGEASAAVIDLSKGDVRQTISVQTDGTVTTEAARA